MLNCKLTKIETLPNAEVSDNPLRTNVVEGSFNCVPIVGSNFRMFSTSLDPSKVLRYVATSTIKAVQHEEDSRIYLFETENSKYQLEILPVEVYKFEDETP